MKRLKKIVISVLLLNYLIIAISFNPWGYRFFYSIEGVLYSKNAAHIGIAGIVCMTMLLLASLFIYFIFKKITSIDQFKKYFSYYLTFVFALAIIFLFFAAENPINFSCIACDSHFEYEMQKLPYFLFFLLTAFIFAVFLFIKQI